MRRLEVSWKPACSTKKSEASPVVLDQIRLSSGFLAIVSGRVAECLGGPNSPFCWKPRSESLSICFSRTGTLPDRRSPASNATTRLVSHDTANGATDQRSRRCTCIADQPLGYVPAASLRSVCRACKCASFSRHPPCSLLEVCSCLLPCTPFTRHCWGKPRSEAFCWTFGGCFWKKRGLQNPTWQELYRLVEVLSGVNSAGTAPTTSAVDHSGREQRTRRRRCWNWTRWPDVVYNLDPVPSLPWRCVLWHHLQHFISRTFCWLIVLRGVGRCANGEL